MPRRAFAHAAAEGKPAAHSQGARRLLPSWEGDERLAEGDGRVSSTPPAPGRPHLPEIRGWSPTATAPGLTEHPAKSVHAVPHVR